MAQYDPSNIFARILRGEIPNRTVAETAHTLAFHDVRPQAPVHVLVIPKGPYVNFDDFCRNASDAEIVDFHRTAGRICADLGLTAEKGGNGYRTISNAGTDGMQEVPHFHIHLMGGRVMGRLIEPA